eukprot:833076-Alexandrium_andersonii.AAC.1
MPSLFGPLPSCGKGMGTNSPRNQPCTRGMACAPAIGQTHTPIAPEGRKQVQRQGHRPHRVSHQNSADTRAQQSSGGRHGGG